MTASGRALFLRYFSRIATLLTIERFVWECSWCWTGLVMSWTLT